jgi:hypothetical protein
MSDERTLRLKRRLRQFTEGRLDAPLGDQELLELLIFAYQEASDSQAVVSLYHRIELANLAPADRKRAARMFQVALTRTQGGNDIEREDGQARLF